MKHTQTTRVYKRCTVIRDVMITPHGIVKNITVQKDMGDYYETINPNSEEASEAIINTGDLID